MCACPQVSHSPSLFLGRHLKSEHSPPRLKAYPSTLAQRNTGARWSRILGRFVPQDLSGSYINLPISFYFSNGNWATFRETFLKSVPTHGSTHLHLPFSSPCPALPSPPSIFCQPCFVQIVTFPRMNLECLDFEIWAPTLRKVHISWCTMTLCDLGLPQELPVWWVRTSFCCGQGSRKTGSKSL